jgi:hypothetical protein
MMVTAAMAREMSIKAKPADTSVEIAMDRIVERAKLGYFGANVLVPNEHVDEVASRLSILGFDVRVDSERVFHTDLKVAWGTNV